MLPALSIEVTVRALGPGERPTVYLQLNTVPSFESPVLMVVDATPDDGSGSVEVPSRTTCGWSVSKSAPELVVISTIGSIESTDTAKGVDQPDTRLVCVWHWARALTKYAPLLDHELGCVSDPQSDSVPSPQSNWYSTGWPRVVVLPPVLYVTLSPICG